MHKLRLLLLSAVVVAFCATCIAQSQDGTGGLDDQVQNKFSDKDQDQAKPDKKPDKAKIRNNDGHRKHWWSLPHFRHKKHDKDSAVAQPQLNSNSKSAKRVNNAPLPKQTVHKTETSARPENHRAMATKPGRKTAAGKAHTNNTIARHTTPVKGRGKTVASTTHTGKPVRHDCTSAEAKKGGCQAVQKHTAKSATRSS